MEKARFDIGGIDCCVYFVTNNNTPKEVVTEVKNKATECGFHLIEVSKKSYNDHLFSLAKQKDAELKANEFLHHYLIDNKEWFMETTNLSDGRALIFWYVEDNADGNA